LDKEYLIDYEAKESAEYETLVKKIFAGKYDSENEIYPPAHRFKKINHPIAIAGEGLGNIENLWGQIPFSGSLILTLPSIPSQLFEKTFFEISEIPKVIDFVKSTGRLQIALEEKPTHYERLDFLDPIFKELNPPYLLGAPIGVIGSMRDINKARACYFSLGQISFFEFLKRSSLQTGYTYAAETFKESLAKTFVHLKLRDTVLARAVEDALIDNPFQAFVSLCLYQRFISTPSTSLCFDLHNFSLDTIKAASFLRLRHHTEKIYFPYEIGKILVRKLTYAPVGLEACREVIYHYDAYDLRRVLEAVNQAIASNSPDVLNKGVGELSEILDNVWRDKTLPRRIKGLQIGIPLSMAAIGSVSLGPIGTIGGLLAALGYTVMDKLIDLGTDGLSEKIAKLSAKSYQANIFDFKKKYKTLN
jgi:hypothetical protein